MLLKYNNSLISFCILLLLSLCSFDNLAQYADTKKAKEYFGNNNFAEALQQYLRLLKSDPNNAEYNYKIGICYLRTNIDKSEAIPYLEKTVKQSKFDIEVWFDLALAYQYNLRFDDAIKTYQKYKEITSTKKLDVINKQIENCYTAKELIKFPVDVTFENLGDKINTPYPDYYPFVSKDGTFLIYTSRRPDNIEAVLEFDGFYPSDIWYTTLENNAFSKSKNVGYLINETYDEQAVGLSDDGNTVFIYIDNIKEIGDIYTSERTLKNFKKKEKLGSIVNSTYIETSASISSDGNILFFASNRPGGNGGLDLYMYRKLPTGEWAEPQNLGKEINTLYHEDFPSLSADGKTLYFCSQGHESMGGYDLFKTTWNPENNTWSNPKNLGYPINTPEDNMTISFTEDNAIAYISAFRKGGRGDLDIYKVKFNKLTPDYTVFHFNLSNKAIQDASFTVEHAENNELAGVYHPQNNGYYLIILAPGKYTLMVEANGYLTYTEELIVKDNIKNEEFIKTISLKTK